MVDKATDHDLEQTPRVGRKNKPTTKMRFFFFFFLVAMAPDSNGTRAIYLRQRLEAGLADANGVRGQRRDALPLGTRRAEALGALLARLLQVRQVRVRGNAERSKPKQHWVQRKAVDRGNLSSPPQPL